MKILWKTNFGGTCAHALRAGKYESLCGVAAGRPTLWTRPRPGMQRCNECMRLTANSVKQPVALPRAANVTAIKVMTLADVQDRLGPTITECALASGWLKAYCIVNNGGERRASSHRLYAVKDVDAVRNRIRNGQYPHSAGELKNARLRTSSALETGSVTSKNFTLTGSSRARRFSEAAAVAG